MRESVATSPGRHGCRPAVRHRRSVELRAKRYDHAPRRRPSVRSNESSLHTRTARLDTTIYRRRRRVVGLAVAIAVSVLSLGVQAALTDPGSGPASAAGIGTATVSLTVRAERGDSLWNIADEYHGDVAITRYLDKLIELNGGTSIEAGQLVRLP